MGLDMFGHPKQMFKLMDKKLFTILRLKFCLFCLLNVFLDESLEFTCRSFLQEHSVQMGLDMYGHPKQMFKLMDKKLFTILLLKFCLFCLLNVFLDESLESTCRSLLQEHSVQMGLDMFGHPNRWIRNYSKFYAQSLLILFMVRTGL